MDVTWLHLLCATLGSSNIDGSAGVQEEAQRIVAQIRQSCGRTAAARTQARLEAIEHTVERLRGPTTLHVTDSADQTPLTPPPHSTPHNLRRSHWLELLYDQALLAEASPIEDTAGFAKKLTRLLTTAAQYDLAPAPSA